MLSELFSAFIPKAQAEEQQEPAKEEKADAQESKEETKEEPEPEEPEDLAPAIREECSETNECKGAKVHFEHCTEKVSGGKGYKHEDCVEEILMHCVDGCAAPKLFAKLK